MAETDENKTEQKKSSWWHRFSLKKLNSKYVFSMSHDETLEPIVDFKVNLMNLAIISLLIILFFIIVTAIVIAFTPLREYIPGYAEKNTLDREVYALYRRADSIERELERKDEYFNNLKLVIEGYDFEDDSLGQTNIYAPLPGFDIDTIVIKKSVQDSALRAEFEEANRYNLSLQTLQSNLVNTRHYAGVANFFTPLTGDIVKEFNPNEGHYGIDVAATENQLIKSTLDGTVVYATWTIDFGYTIGIQHDNNYYSAYMHNAALLKKEGDIVKAGEAIAILGESGELMTSPHLHFELWHNGIALNPQDYINFKHANE